MQSFESREPDLRGDIVVEQGLDLRVCKDSHTVMIWERNLIEKSREKEPEPETDMENKRRKREGCICVCVCV